METIKNAASTAVNTASSYIYGTQPTESNTQTTESGTEPVSGQTGKGTADEPYDKGNEEPSSGTDSKPTESSSTGTSSAPSHGASVAGGSTDPSTGADPASGQKPFQKQQGGDRPTEAPDSGPEHEAVKETKDEGEELLKKRDPNDHSGEPMKMHDGSDSNEDKEEDQEHPGQEGGGKHGEKKGTGEEWIKTSGLKADGGDFDASKAGAGREADRLLEEKGIVKDDRGAMVDKEGKPVNPTDHKSPSPSGGHSKVKTMDKLKEKLHIGTGKKL